MNHANLITSIAEHNGSHPAIRMGEYVQTYSELTQESEKISSALQREGVAENDRVMLYADNSVEHLVLYHALARIGAVFTPVHPEFKEKELAYAISNSKPRLIIASSHLISSVCVALKKTGHKAEIIFLESMESGCDLENYKSFSDFVSSGVGGCHGDLDVDPKHPLLISYTSGTTALPKPVLRSHESEIWSARSYRRAWGFQPEDRLLISMSLSWVYGLCSLAQTVLATGATILLEKKFSPTKTLELIDAGKVTAFAGTMSMYSMMLSIMRERDFDTSSLKKLFLGGEPRNESIIAEFESRVGLRLCEGWAMTESFPALAIHPEHDVSAPVGSMGRSVDEVEIKLVDEFGKEVEEGEVGEAMIRSPGNFLGYYDEPELTAQRCTDDGWIISGDLMRKDANGYFMFVARKGEMIIRGGVNISPSEVETALSEYSYVEDAIVFGMPDDILGEIVVALVSAREGSVVDTVLLDEFLQTKIAKFKVPNLVVQVDAIPRGKTGKKNRAEARATFESFQEKNFG